MERRAAIYEELAKVIDMGRSAASGANQPPEVTAEGIVGAVSAVLHTRVLEGGKEPLLKLLGPLMSIIVLPYLGARAAGRELSRPVPEIPKDLRSRPRKRTADPLEGLNMRLTYRTVRVLMVISDHPGASNREIAEGSGIADQGQISKLLNRLARLELVENLGEGQGEGRGQRLVSDGARLGGRAGDTTPLSHPCEAPARYGQARAGRARSWIERAVGE